MESRTNFQYKKISFIASLVILINSLVVFVGHLVGWIHTSHRHFNLFLKFDGTVLFAVCGFALYLLSTEENQSTSLPHQKVIAKILAAMVMVAAIIDGFLYRITSNGAVGITLTCLSLIFVDRDTRIGKKASEVFGIFVLFVSVLAIVGIAFEVKPFYSAFPGTLGMTLQAAICFFIFGAGVLFLNPDSGWMKTLTSEAIGGYFARRHILGLLVIFFLYTLPNIAIREFFGAQNQMKQLGFSVGTLLGFTVMTIIVMRNARQANEVDFERQQAHRRLAFHYQITRVVAESDSLITAAPKILQAICDNLDWHMGILWSVDSSSQLLRCMDIWSRSKDDDKFQKISKEYAFVKGVGLPGRVWESGKPQWIVNFGEEPTFPRSKYALQVGYRSAFAFPVVFGKETSGVLEFFCTKKRPPDEVILEMMANLGSQIGQFIQRKKAEREAIQAKADLLAVASHDLKNPIAAIALASNVILRALRSDFKRYDVIQRQAEGIKRSSENMKKLVEDLLDQSKFEAGRILISKKKQDVNSIIRESIDLLLPLAKEKAIALEWELESGELMANCDRERVLQVLSNLIGNATKFTAPGGKITVSVKSKASEIEFCVKDTGVGIPTEQLSRIFDRYWQGEAAAIDQSEMSGAGLGLFIARGIVNAHGGKIWAKSQTGLGTEFYFTLPDNSEAGTFEQQSRASAMGTEDRGPVV